MALGGADGEGRSTQHAHIVIGRDARFAAGGRHAERAAAAENELRFAEEGAFLVFIFGRVGVFLAVGELVRAVHDDERALLVLVVNGGAVGIRQVQSVQDDGLLLFAVNLEESVLCRAGKLVADRFLGGVVHGHVVAEDGHDAVVVAAHRRTRGRKHDGDGAVEGRVGDVIVFVLEDEWVLDGGVRDDRIDGVCRV